MLRCGWTGEMAINRKNKISRFRGVLPWVSLKTPNDLRGLLKQN